MQDFFKASFSETKHDKRVSKNGEKIMSKFTNPLNNLKIASPCTADWNQMVGDNRQRHCGDCKLNVYNLSGMTRSKAENLILNFEGRVCLRIYRRADGTVLTKDCPVGWSAVKQRVSKVATAFASMIFAVLGGIGLTNYFTDSADDSKMMGKIVIENQHPPINDNYPMMGNFTIPDEDISEYEMGKMEINTNQSTLGAPNVKSVKRKIIKNRR